MPISKTIHIIWIGDETKRPDRWIKTWREMNPGYALKVWGNAEVSAESWMLGDRINGWLQREINGAADVIRWEILFRYGGIAFDADCACVRPLEDWLLEPECFGAWEHELLRPGLIACGAMGFTPQHFLIGTILKDILADPDPYGAMAWEKVGPKRFTDTVRRIGFNNLTVYPSHYFFPRHYSGAEYGGAGPVFAKQFWGSTNRHWQTTNPDAVAFDAGKEQIVLPDTVVAALAEPTTEPAAVAPTGSDTELATVERGAHKYFYLQRMKVSDVRSRLDYFRDICAGKRVLHVGCTDYPVFDPARNLHIQIQDVCAKLDGLDTDTNGLATLANYVDGAYYNDVEDVAGAYDVLLVPETIEHVNNIKDFLLDLDRIDFKDIVITAPCVLGWNQCFNYRDYPGQRSALLQAPDDYLEEVHPDHKAWFTPYTLANCIEQFSSWRIEKIMFLEGKRMTGVHCVKQ